MCQCSGILTRGGSACDCLQMFALLAALQTGERHADLRDSRTFETLYAVSDTFTGYAENMAMMGIPHADLRDNNVELL